MDYETFDKSVDTLSAYQKDIDSVEIPNVIKAVENIQFATRHRLFHKDPLWDWLIVNCLDTLPALESLRQNLIHM